MPRPAVAVDPTRSTPDFLELRQHLAHLEAVLRPWPDLRVGGLTMRPGLTSGWEEWGAARGCVHLRRASGSQAEELLGWLRSDGGRLERPYRDIDPYDGWHLLWRGWRFYTQVPVEVVPQPMPPGGPLFHDFPDGPGALACRRPGCSAGSRQLSARTPCSLPRHLAELIDGPGFGPRRAA